MRSRRSARSADGGAPAALRDTSPSRILVIKLTSIGDVAHTIPSSFALAQRWPGARQDWLVDPVCADVVRALPWVGQTVELDSLARRHRGAAWVRHLRDVREALRREA